MAQLNFDKVSPMAERGLLAFLNRAFFPKDILKLDLVKSKDSEQTDYGIGFKVAQRIIARKRELGEFTELSQLNGIDGFGQEKFEDLVQTFSISSAERFRRTLYNEHILFENFEVKYHAITFDSLEDFLACVQDEEAFRQLIVNNLVHLASENTSEEDLQKACTAIQQSYIEKFHSMHVASHAFALWFYHFDEDNWFSFSQMQSVSEPYLSLSYHESDVAGFYLFKGFENHLILKSGISVLDLPVVANPDELAVYLWGVLLFD